MCTGEERYERCLEYERHDMWRHSVTVWRVSDFSVIIPTLQRAKELPELVELCAAHPRVLEVLVINNAPAPLAWGSPKVRVLQQAENIYVNPAWNLGARQALGRYLAILNDDITLDASVFDVVLPRLRRRTTGAIGIGASCLTATSDSRPYFSPAFIRNPSFGIAMFLRRDTWVPIPEDMLIWFGDDWIFTRQDRVNFTLEGFRVCTEMSVTSGDRKFSPVIAADHVAARHHGDADYYRRMRVRRSLARIQTRLSFGRRHPRLGTEGHDVAARSQ